MKIGKFQKNNCGAGYGAEAEDYAPVGDGKWQKVLSRSGAENFYILSTDY